MKAYTPWEWFAWDRLHSLPLQLFKSQDRWSVCFGQMGFGEESAMWESADWWATPEHGAESMLPSVRWHSAYHRKLQSTPALFSLTVSAKPSGRHRYQVLQDYRNLMLVGSLIHLAKTHPDQKRHVSYTIMRGIVTSSKRPSAPVTLSRYVFGIRRLYFPKLITIAGQ